MLFRAGVSPKTAYALKYATKGQPLSEKKVATVGRQVDAFASYALCSSQSLAHCFANKCRISFNPVDLGSSGDIAKEGIPVSSSTHWKCSLGKVWKFGLSFVGL